MTLKCHAVRRKIRKMRAPGGNQIRVTGVPRHPPVVLYTPSRRSPNLSGTLCPLSVPSESVHPCWDFVSGAARDSHRSTKYRVLVPDVSGAVERVAGSLYGSPNCSSKSGPASRLSLRQYFHDYPIAGGSFGAGCQVPDDRISFKRCSHPGFGEEGEASSCGGQWKAW